MDYHPPIATRETEKLLEIIRAPEDWTPMAVEEARLELAERGIGVDEQKNREKSFKKYVRNTNAIKAAASYSNLEFGLLIVFGVPIAAICLGFMYWPFGHEPEYTTKRWQVRNAMLIGTLLWIGFFLMLD